MKRSFYLLIGAFVLIAPLAVKAQSYLQDPKYGATEAEREQNVLTLTYFNSAIEEKDYPRAAGYMQELIEKAPRASENIYIKGARMYEDRFKRAKSKDERETFIDSLLWVQDKRIEAFRDHPERGESAIRTLKAMTVRNLMPQDDRFIKLAEEALTSGDVNSDLAVIYFNTLAEGFKLDDVSPEDLMDRYARLTDVLSKQKGKEAEEALSAVENLFVTSGAASCENIEKIFKPQYEADPNNAELIEKILALFQRSKCSSAFQMELLEKYYATNPKPEVATYLAFAYQEKGDNEKAMEYLKVAIDSETDQDKKVSFLTQAAGMSLNANSYREAANFANQILNIDSSNGYAYFFRANAFAAGSGSACSDFDRQAVFWLVVDNLQQARKNLPEDDPQINEINRMIGNYSANFPKSEETFFRNLKPGDGYTVNCGWISGRTSVRER